MRGGLAFLEDEVRRFPKKGRLRLQRFPVGQAEPKALGSVSLVPNKRRNWYIALRVELVSGGDGM